MAADDLHASVPGEVAVIPGLALYLGGLPEERRSGGRQIASRLEAVQPALAEIETHLGERLTIGALGRELRDERGPLYQAVHDVRGADPEPVHPVSGGSPRRRRSFCSPRVPSNQIAEQLGFGKPILLRAGVRPAHGGVAGGVSEDGAGVRFAPESEWVRLCEPAEIPERAGQAPPLPHWLTLRMQTLHYGKPFDIANANMI